MGWHRQSPPDDCRATLGFPGVDGPLIVEFQQQGVSFEFDGRRDGMESGTYFLRDGRCSGID
jgi:hypothetical protein